MCLLIENVHFSCFSSTTHCFLCPKDLTGKTSATGGEQEVTASRHPTGADVPHSCKRANPAFNESPEGQPEASRARDGMNVVMTLPAKTTFALTSDQNKCRNKVHPERGGASRLVHYFPIVLGGESRCRRPGEILAPLLAAGG